MLFLNQTASVGNFRSNGVTAVDCATTEDWFDAEKMLGKRGHKYFTEPVKYCLAALKKINLDIVSDFENGGIFLGSASIDRSIRQETAQKLMLPEEHALGAAMAPNMSVNVVASILAQKLKFSAHNFTFTGGSDAALLALNSAAQFLKGRNLSEVILGHIEHIPEGCCDSGAILWHLSTQAKTDEAVSISSIAVARYSNERQREKLLSLIDSDSLVLAEGNDDAEGITELADIAHQRGADFNSIQHCGLVTAFNQSDLFFTLTQILAKGASKKIFVLSQSGHFFYLDLN